MAATAIEVADARPAPTLACAREALLAGRARDSAALLETLCAEDPGAIDALYWLASARLAKGEHAAGAETLKAATTAHALAVMRHNGADLARVQSDPAYAALVGSQLYDHRLVATAAVAFGAALAHGLSPRELVQYGLSLQHSGRAGEAIEAFRLATELQPAPTVHQHLLFALFFGENGVRRYPEEARRWAALHARAPSGRARRHANSPSRGRKLRIGYVAPSFSRSQLSQFILPVLEAHDPASVKLHLYSADPTREAGLPTSAVVRAIGAKSDAEAAALIRADQIDVLVDLWGHTAGSRLPVFVHRPAPVQAAWANFVQTTGLDCIDHVLHADSMAAPGTEALFVEQVRHVGEACIPYRPHPDRPAVAPAPALANGFVTFGSFNNPAKLSDATVAAWAAILRGRDGSRLLLKYGYFADPVLQRSVQARFAAHRVAPERIVFQGHSAGADYLAAFAGVDLALDPSPCPGGTTTCDALAAGVPVLTLAGPDFYSRIGIAPVTSCGTPELVADSWDDYVARAIALSGDSIALDALRRRVREGFDRGAFRDEAGFTRRLEAMFRDMFDAWRGGGQVRLAS